MGAALLFGQLLMVFALTAFTLHKYGNWRKQNPLVTISTLISWYFAFIIIFLIPLDVVMTFYLQCKTTIDYGNSTKIANISGNTSSLIENQLSNVHVCKKPSSFISRNALINLWEFVYWTSQLLTWIILPVMQSYCKAGEFTVVGKLKSALVENAIYYASFVVLFILLLIYVAAQGISLYPSNLKTICITASNTWGLFVLVILLGYGLVEIPRRLWLNSFTKNYSLQKTYFDVEKLSTDKNDAEENLREVYKEAKAACENLRDDARLRYYAEIIMKVFPESLLKQVSRRQDASQSSTSAAAAAYRVSAAESAAFIARDEKSLAALHKRAIECVNAQHRCEALWRALIDKALHLEDVARNEQANIGGGSRQFIRSTKRQMGSLEALICTPAIEWYWECFMKRPLLKALAVFCAILTIFIVWSEVTFFLTKPVLSLAAVFVQLAAKNSNYDYIEVSSILTISYLCICAYYTVFRIRIYRYYHLDPHHNSDENSLLFSAILFCRLTPPLCLNFLSLIHMDSHVTHVPMPLETAYTSFMGHMDVMPFIVNGFNVYFPAAVLLFCLATYFRLAAKCLHYIGIEQFIDDDQMTSELVQGGKGLVSAERSRQQRSVDREARGEFWREKLADHDPSRPLRRNLADRRTYQGGDQQAAPNYNDNALILENAEPIATVSRDEDGTGDPFAYDANNWFSGYSSINNDRRSQQNPRSTNQQNLKENKGIFDDL